MISLVNVYRGDVRTFSPIKYNLLTSKNMEKAANPLGDKSACE